ncbi:MAG: hypothetical protein JW967_08785 [Dehalococcoidales bacterium]|nr:hypothetical protein [Dehalococcoidales bacterium]
MPPYNGVSWINSIVNITKTPGQPLLVILLVTSLLLSISPYKLVIDTRKTETEQDSSPPALRFIEMLVN